MIILGIDPGLALTGYGLVEERQNGFKRIASGTVRTSRKTPGALRLAAIYDAVTELIRQYQPRAVAVEKLFFCKNVRTAMQVGEARGTILLAAAKNNLDLYEYTPLQVKQAVAGYGQADKLQVQRMVELLLKLAQPITAADEADALAIALCHLQNFRYHEAVKGGR
ncbi:MAG: crossover junction endodeoxyribonuclease RuvC [Firmicutes bacterium]|nr:crossover junction endodeoxyribonuclease RuvC [Bacillota bacterium]